MARRHVLRISLTATLAFLLATAPGCSTKRDSLLGNKRIARGDGSLGETTQQVLAPDRDTYAAGGTADFGPTIILGIRPDVQTRAFFRVPTWTIPDQTDTTVVVQSVFFEMPYDTLGISQLTNLTIALATASAYDTLAAWPGPAPSIALGQVNAQDVAPFRIQMSLTTYPLIQGWAADPSTLPGLMLYPTAGNDDLVSLVAGAARLRIGYSHVVSGATVVDTVNTAIPLDFYMRSPPLSPPTGSEPALVLGGQYDSAVPLHFPATAVPEGSTVNEASLRLRVDPSSPLSSRPEGVKILVRRLRSPWSESVTERASLDSDSLAFASRSAVVLSSPADSVITIALPQEIIREWTSAGGVNEGLMLTVERANRAPAIVLRARESGVPIELRVSTTTPPPGRF